MATGGDVRNEGTTCGSGEAQSSFATRVGNAFSALDDIGKTQDTNVTNWQLHQSLVCPDSFFPIRYTRLVTFDNTLHDL